MEYLVKWKGWVSIACWNEGCQGGCQDVYPARVRASVVCGSPYGERLGTPGVPAATATRGKMLTRPCEGRVGYEACPPGGGSSLTRYALPPYTAGG
eukprot:739960-Prorocentrum_minimum.AAC.3